MAESLSPQVLFEFKVFLLLDRLHTKELSLSYNLPKIVGYGFSAKAALLRI